LTEFYVPQYLIDEQKDVLAPADNGKVKSKYSKCTACAEFVHEDDWANHRKMYCDPGHVRKKQWTTRPTPKRIIGGYILGLGVNPRPIDSPPAQILRGRCKNCNATLAITDDPLCVVCSGRP
jgi:hypothetical protein